MRNRGFTLIELLIVVAIIGILAAIALPNFLDAQIRAKASRAKADLKTITTALEMYRVDHNGYPTYHYIGAELAPHYVGGKVPGWNVPDPDWNGWNPLTTPIAYLTTFPNDPFARDRKIVPEARQYYYVNWPYAIETVGWPIFYLTYREYGAYRLHSRGADGNGPDTGIPYDPTNGSVSNGDIIYAQKTGFSDYIPFPIVPDE